MPPLIPIPHDALFKAFLSDVSIAKDFFAIHLPQTIKPHCDFNTLKIQPTVFVDDDLKYHVADVLYSIQIKDRPGYLYCLVEHETRPSPLTAWRMLRYSVATIKQHLEQHGGTTLPLVVPLLFYRGQQTPYPYTTSVMDCFGAPELARELWLKPYPLIDLSVIPDEELRTHQSVALLELIQKHIHTRDMLEFVQDITYYLNQDQACPERVDALLRYIVQEGECSDYGTFFQTLAQQTQRYRENVMTIAQQLRQEGMQEGMQKGEQAGLEQARKAMARSMLDAQEPLEKITRYTGLSAQDIALLQTQH